MTLARRANIISPNAVVVPGSQVLTKQTIDPRAIGDATPIMTHTTRQAERALGIEDIPHEHKEID
jgi:hypothetical protein